MVRQFFKWGCGPVFISMPQYHDQQNTGSCQGSKNNLVMNRPLAHGDGNERPDTHQGSFTHVSCEGQQEIDRCSQGDHDDRPHGRGQQATLPVQTYQVRRHIRHHDPAQVNTNGPPDKHDGSQRSIPDLRAKPQGQHNQRKKLNEDQQHGNAQVFIEPCCNPQAVGDIAQRKPDTGLLQRLIFPVSEPGIPLVTHKQKEQHIDDSPNRESIARRCDKEYFVILKKF